MMDWPLLAFGGLLVLGWCVAPGVIGSSAYAVLNKLACQGVATVHTLPEGLIVFPPHPGAWRGRVSCQWIIFNPLQEALVLRFIKFDLHKGEKSDDFLQSCSSQWLKIETKGLAVDREEADGTLRDRRRRKGHGARGSFLKKNLNHKNSGKVSKMRWGKYSFPSLENVSPSLSVEDAGDAVSTGLMCGNDFPVPMTTRAPRVYVTFFSKAMVSSSNHGFRLQYHTGNKTTCSSEEFACKRSDVCIPKRQQCNRKFECPDRSDEDDCEVLQQDSCLPDHFAQRCDGTWQCPKGQDEMGCCGCGGDWWWCGTGLECYSAAQRCDGTLDCSNAMDELSCSQQCVHRILCSRGGCYSVSQRCDGTNNCGDGSDEAACTSDLCNAQHGAFLCRNKKCIHGDWRCDQVDDCRDGSDEEDCIRNSVIGVAAMGGLVCSLLLVVAVGCTGRLYALRMGLNRMQSQGQGGLQGSSPRSRLEEHLLQREPPPSYDVAVNDQSTPLFGNCVDWHWRRQRRRPSALQERVASPLASPLASPRVPAYGNALPEHSPQGPGPTVGIHGEHGQAEKEGEERAKVNAFFPGSEVLGEANQMDVTLLSALVVDCVGADNDDDDVPLLFDLTSSDSDTDHEEPASVCAVSEVEERCAQGDTATVMDPLPCHHSAHGQARACPRTWDGTSSSFGGNVSMGTCESQVDDDVALCGSEDYAPSPCNLDEEVPLIGDVISDTRAAALALSAVQWHTNEVTDNDTEMICQ